MSDNSYFRIIVNGEELECELFWSDEVSEYGEVEIKYDYRPRWEETYTAVGSLYSSLTKAVEAVINFYGTETVGQLLQEAGTDQLEIGSGPCKSVVIKPKR